MTKDNPVAAGVADCEKPLTPLMSDNGDPEWQQILSLFSRHGAPEPHWRLRDELVTILAWARYGAAASPVQAGIDPLVAEIEALVKFQRDMADFLSKEAALTNEDREYWAKLFNAENCIQTAALLRSQAERIAALEVDLKRCENMHLPEATVAAIRGHQNCMSAFESVQLRALTAESLLAEAREALEEAAEYVAFNHFASDRHRAVELVHKFRATLSRLKPGEKGGE